MTRTAHWVELTGRVATECRAIDGDFIFKLDVGGQLVNVILKNRKRGVKVNDKLVIEGFLIDGNLLGYKCKPVRIPIRDL